MKNLVIVILIVALVIGGVVYFLMNKKSGTEVLENVSIVAPSLDLSLSPLPKLEISAFNISGSGLPSGGMFSNISVNSDFSYTGNTDLAVPTIQIDASSLVPDVETPVSETPAQNPSQGSNTINASTCAQFTGVPSCSMTGSGQSICEQCRAVGF